MKETCTKLGSSRQRKSSDRRVLRTRRNIREAFFQLLNDKDPEKITVSEIANLADIDRKTFYLHYASIEDLVEEEAHAVVKRLTRVIVEDGPSEGDPFGMRKLVSELIAVSDSAPQAYRRALRTMSNEQLVKLLSEPVCEAVFEARGIEAEEDLRACRYLVLFCLSGALSAFSLYLEEDDTPTAEEVLEIVDAATALMNGRLADRRSGASKAS